MSQSPGQTTFLVDDIIVLTEQTADAIEKLRKAKTWAETRCVFTADHVLTVKLNEFAQSARHISERIEPMVDIIKALERDRKAALARLNEEKTQWEAGKSQREEDASFCEDATESLKHTINRLESKMQQLQDDVNGKESELADRQKQTAAARKELDEVLASQKTITSGHNERETHLNRLKEEAINQEAMNKATEAQLRQRFQEVEKKETESQRLLASNEAVQARNRLDSHNLQDARNSLRHLVGLTAVDEAWSLTSSDDLQALTSSIAEQYESAKDAKRDLEHRLSQESKRREDLAFTRSELERSANEQKASLDASKAMHEELVEVHDELSTRASQLQEDMISSQTELVDLRKQNQAIGKENKQLQTENRHLSSFYEDNKQQVDEYPTLKAHERTLRENVEVLETQAVKFQQNEVQLKKSLANATADHDVAVKELDRLKADADAVESTFKEYEDRVIEAKRRLRVSEGDVNNLREELQSLKARAADANKKHLDQQGELTHTKDILSEVVASKQSLTTEVRELKKTVSDLDDKYGKQIKEIATAKANLEAEQAKIPT